MNNKVKKARKVTFKEDYFSSASQVEAEKLKTTAAPIYRKDEVHYIHEDVVASLEKKGAKMKVEKIDWEKGVREAQKALAERNRIIEESVKA